MAEEWPDWEISEQSAWQLARYVDPEAAEVPLGVHLRRQWEDAGAAEARAAELYRLVSGRDIQYAKDPWNPARFGFRGSGARQRIRTPAEVLQGVGSCLDLSLLFAGLAMAANIRPFIALTLNARTPHVVVVLDLSEPLSNTRRAKHDEGPDHWLQNRDGHGVWRPQSAGQSPRQQSAPWWQLHRSQWLTLDISRAARSGAAPPQEFEEACLTALPWASADSPVTWILIDVEAALDEQEFHVPPIGRARYPIHSYLPEIPRFTEYPTRQALTLELSGQVRGATPGRLILQGPGGRGKSLLAQQLAWGADNGCGWFLNATDVETLRTSLAAAEQAEIGQWSETGDRAERPNATEVAQLAYAALRRLNSAEVPWVVVLDNCDVPPDTAGLTALIPQPRLPGQVVIMTTRHEGWSQMSGGWASTPLPPLGNEDLEKLGLPPGLASMAKDPLIAEPFGALASLGTPLPEEENDDPHGLVWTLLRDKLGTGSRAIRLAELLAWLPPEPTNIDAAPIGPDLHARQEAADELVNLRFLAPVSRVKDEPQPATPGARGAVAQPASESAPGPRTFRVQMHRMFAAAIRANIGADSNRAVLDVLGEVLTSAWGRRAFIEAADQAALQLLERGELEQATGSAGDGRVTGLAWHGLGHIRERRGPVSLSGAAFRTALDHLDPVTHPYETAEAMIGLTRIAFQASKFDQGALLEGQARIGPARELLAQVPGVDARQLREQGNALFWLIERKLSARNKDPERRFSLLTGVRDELWRSYEQRLRITRRLDDGAVVTREPPRLDDGLGPERAYYNLAGVHLELAKARYDRAEAWWPSASPEERSALLDDVAEDLEAASDVYRQIADLRARQYRNQPHPHHAACINGNAIVAYHRAALLNKPEYLVEAARWVAAALEERWQIAFFSPDVPNEDIITNDDVSKSLSLLSKISVAGSAAAAHGTGQQVGTALAAVSDALAELVNWHTYQRVRG
jgi:hypothetical protein